MIEVELFEKVKSGEITSTKEFRVKALRRGTDDWKKDQTFWALLDLIDSGDIEGSRVPNDTDGNYEALKVTKRGMKVYKFLKTPIDRIGKPTFIESCKNGIISAFAGKLVWWAVATVVILVIPTFVGNAELILTELIRWAVE